MEGENRLTVSELVEGVMPCIRAKHYSETYISGFQQIFNRMLSYCEDHKEQSLIQTCVSTYRYRPVANILLKKGSFIRNEVRSSREIQKVLPVGHSLQHP